MIIHLSLLQIWLLLVYDWQMFTLLLILLFLFRGWCSSTFVTIGRVLIQNIHNSSFSYIVLHSLVYMLISLSPSANEVYDASKNDSNWDAYNENILSLIQTITILTIVSTIIILQYYWTPKPLQSILNMSPYYLEYFTIWYRLSCRFHFVMIDKKLILQLLIHNWF